AEEDHAARRMLGEQLARARVESRTRDADHEETGDGAAEEARGHRTAYSNRLARARTRAHSGGSAAPPVLAGPSRRIRGWGRSDGGATSRSRDPSGSERRPSRDGSPPSSAPSSSWNGSRTIHFSANSMRIPNVTLSRPSCSSRW